jgi:hypothetical protein
MNDVAVGNSGLPAELATMRTALASSINAVGGAGGSDQYMKMNRQGEFVYGAENTEVEEGSRWAVNPMAFQHGFTAWGTEAYGNEGTNVGEVLVPFTSPMPQEADLPEVKGNWSKAVQLQLRCLTGEDEGIQALWKSNALGGRKAYAALMQALMQHLEEDQTTPVAVVELEADSYTHTKYGKIFTPVFKVVGWNAMDSAAAPAEAEPEPEPELEGAEEKPRRRRRKA